MAQLHDPSRWPPVPARRIERASSPRQRIKGSLRGVEARGPSLGCASCGACRNAGPVRLIENYARAATWEHGTSSRSIFLKSPSKVAERGFDHRIRPAVFRRSRLQSRKWSGGDDHKFGRALGPDMPRWPAVAQTGTPVRINQAAAVCLKVCGVNIVRRRWQTSQANGGFHLHPLGPPCRRWRR